MDQAKKDNNKIAPLSLRQNVIWNGLGSLVYQGSQWLLTVLVVILSANYENSGILAFAMTMGNIFTPIATYSVRTFQVSDVSNEYSQQCYIAFRMITIVAGFILTCLYASIVINDFPTLITIMIYLLFKGDEAFSTVLYGIDQKAFRMDYIGISQLIRGAVSLCAFCAGLLLFASLNIAIGWMFASCLCVTWLFDIPHSARFGSIKPSIGKKQISGLLKMCFPAVLATLFGGMVVATARQYFGIQYGSEALGIYAAVATPSVVIQLFAQYLYNPALGPIAERWTSGSRTELKHLIYKLLSAMIVAVVVVVSLLSVVGNPLLLLIFGESIIDYTYLFPFVLIGTGLIAFEWFCTDLLVVFRNMKGALLINIVALFVALTTMQVFIGCWYMNGVNFVIIAANAAALIAAALEIKKSISRRYLQ